MFKNFWNAFDLETRWWLTGIGIVGGFAGFLYGMVLFVTWLETLVGAFWAIIIVAALMLLIAGIAFGIKNAKDYAYVKKKYDEKRAEFRQVLNDYNIAKANDDLDLENLQKFERALSILNDDIICYEKELRRVQECRNWR